MAKMVGKFAPVGVGGRDCSCCGDAPSRRKSRKRSLKRAENSRFRRELVAGRY